MDLQLSNSKKMQDNPTIVAMFNYLEQALKDDEKSKFESLDSSLKSDSSLNSNHDNQSPPNKDVKSGENSINEYDDTFDDPQKILDSKDPARKKGKEGFQDMADAYNELNEKEQENKKYQDLSETDKFLIDHKDDESDKESRKLLDNLESMDQAVKKLSKDQSEASKQPKAKKTVGFARQQTNQESDAVTPVSKKDQNNKKLKKGEINDDLAQAGRSESFSNRPSGYSMTDIKYPDETPRDGQKVEMRSSDKKRQADMTPSELEAYKKLQKQTFRQQRTVEKKGIQLNQNDQEVLDDLRERLVQIMNMDAEERQNLLFPPKGSESESKGLSALQKLKESKKRKEDAQNATNTSQVAGSEAFSPNSTQIKASDREYQGQDSNYTQFSPRYQHGKFSFPQKSVIQIQSFSSNPQIRRIQMTRKIDELLNENKKKEKMLLDLKKQLESYQQADQREKLTTLKVKQQVAKNEELLYSPQKVYQGSIEEQLMDVKATKVVYDFTNVDSCIETKEVIHSKIMLVEQRQRQEERMNYQLHEMAQKLHRRYLDDQKARLTLTEKCENMNVFVNNLIEINNIQGNRMLDIENLDFEFSQKLDKDKQRVIEILDERKIILRNHQHDVSQILYRLLKHLRVIKLLKVQNNHLAYKKRKNMQMEKDIVEVFKKRNKQIEMLNALGQLQQLRNYAEELNVIEHDTELTDDYIRDKGLSLIHQLKIGVQQARDPIAEGEIQFLNEPSPTKTNKSSPNYSHRAGSSNISGRLMIQQDGSPGGKSHSSINSKGLEIVDPKTKHENEHQQILAQIENYSLNRKYFDDFYANFYKEVQVVDNKTIIDTFLMSTIKLNSLQASHKSQEVDKIHKIKELSKLTEQRQFLKNEQSVIGDYIQNLDEGEFLEPQMPQSLEGQILYNDGLQIQNQRNALVTKGRYGIYRDFIATLQDQMIGITAKVKIFKDLQKDMPSDIPPEITKIINRYQEKIKPMKQQHSMRRTFTKVQSTTLTKSQTKNRNSKILKAQKSSGSNSTRNKQRMNEVLQQNSSRKAIETDTMTDLKQERDNSSHQSNRDGSANMLANKFYQSNETLKNTGLDDFITQDDEEDTLGSNFQIQDSNHGSEADIRMKSSKGSPRRTKSKDHQALALAIKQSKRAHSEQAERDKELQEDLMNVLRTLFEGQKSLLQSNQDLTAESLKLRQLNTIRPGKHRGSSPTGHSQNPINQSTIAIEDFDPIFRRRDFNTLQKQVHSMMNYKKTYTRQQYEEMREEVKERLRKKSNNEQVDQDLIDFLASDPRIKTHDEDQKQKDALKNKLQSHQKYNVKEHLWRSKVSEANRHRHQMNRQKMELDNVQREEREFLNQLKEKLNTRYGKLKQSIERDYDMYDKRKAQFATIQNNAASGKQFNQNSQNYDYNISIKSPNSSQFFSPRGRNSLSNKTATAKQKKTIEEENYIKPLKSACFDMEVRKAPASSSLKERIKLNQKLTLSPKTGKVIGIKPNQDLNTLSPGLQTTMNTRINNNDITSPAQNFKKVHSVNRLGSMLSKALIDKVKKQAAIIKSQQSMNNLLAGPYSSNKAYNLTYKTDPRIQQSHGQLQSLTLQQQNSAISNANLKGELLQSQVQDEHFQKYYATQRGSTGVAQFQQHQNNSMRARGRGKSSIQYNLNRYKTSQQMRMDKAITFRSPHHETLQPRTKISDKFGSTSIFASNKQMMSDAFKNRRGDELTGHVGGNSTQSSPRESPNYDGRDEGGSYLEIPDDIVQPQKRLQTAGTDKRVSKFN